MVQFGLFFPRSTENCMGEVVVTALGVIATVLSALSLLP
jgi:hypothetical protein